MRLPKRLLCREINVLELYLLSSFKHAKYFSDYKNTLLLPKTSFPHKIKPDNRVERDRMIEQKSNFDGLYTQQRNSKTTNDFILHDGPPYANGNVHIGHAVNKILKDITVRYQLMKGRKVHYVPGWDCHGLPIELKVLQTSNPDKKPLDIRKKAYDFSQKTKASQLASFKKWGILADWESSYFTCHTNYVIKQLQTFQELYNKGIIFQDYKPVYWSPWNLTSLAEAELEYNQQHISPSIYVKFPVIQCPDFIKAKLGSLKVNIIVWTTTPWSLPANQAVCYAANKKYSIVSHKSSGEFYLMAEEMVSSAGKAMHAVLDEIMTFEASVLKDVTYSHPIWKSRECPLLPGHHVTMSKGTGLVHMAPNHGFDDYTVACQHQLPLDACLVDEKGCYNEQAGEELSGKEVLSSGTDYILGKLKKDIIHAEDFVHSYPYDWRSNKPLIIRSSKQWFVDIQQLREKAIACLEEVQVIPKHIKKLFVSQLTASPQWCISRQRTWGVPIPAFQNSETGNTVIHRLVTEHLCSLIKEHGIHCWWQMPLEQLLPTHLRTQCHLSEDCYERGNDIMDIWFDSGISWRNVLSEDQQSEVCIEGVDQMRGWFNSSLLTSVAVRGKAPYRKLFFHGFVTDAEGYKMSKSKGNVTHPSDIIEGTKTSPAYGIDVLRWWVAYHACNYENVALKFNILDECAQDINKVRNTCKFLLGNLNLFDPTRDYVVPEKMRPLDIYMLHNLYHFQKKVVEWYESMEYRNVAKELLNFVTNDISSFYCQLVKDRLYCDGVNSESRLSCQTVLSFILNSLLQILGPIIPHLSEEVFQHYPHPPLAKNGVFTCEWPSLEDFLKPTDFPNCVSVANQIRTTLLKHEDKTSKMNASIISSSELRNTLLCLNQNTSTENSGLVELLQVSCVSFEDKLPFICPDGAITLNSSVKNTSGKLENYTIVLQNTELEKCVRCRLHSSNMVSTLCKRCTDVTKDNIKVRKDASIVL